uniref:Secreted protein n=1 Tax=Rhizophora mucronata TaxID=61149 RepID=A0A2P2PJB2_RHIMU
MELVCLLFLVHSHFFLVSSGGIIKSLPIRFDPRVQAQTIFDTFNYECVISSLTVRPFFPPAKPFGPLTFSCSVF